MSILRTEIPLHSSGRKRTSRGSFTQEVDSCGLDLRSFIHDRQLPVGLEYFILFESSSWTSQRSEIEVRHRPTVTQHETFLLETLYHLTTRNKESISKKSPQTNKLIID